MILLEKNTDNKIIIETDNNPNTGFTLVFLNDISEREITLNMTATTYNERYIEFTVNNNYIETGLGMLMVYIGSELIYENIYLMQMEEPTEYILSSDDDEYVLREK